MVEIDRHFRASCCTQKQFHDRAELAWPSPGRSPEECRLPEAVRLFNELGSPRELRTAPRAAMEDNWKRSICSEKKRCDEELQKTRTPFRDQVEDCLPRAAIDFREASPEIRRAPVAEIQQHFQTSCCEEKQLEDLCSPRAFGIVGTEMVPTSQPVPFREHTSQVLARQHWHSKVCEEKKKEDVAQQCLLALRRP